MDKVKGFLVSFASKKFIYAVGVFIALIILLATKLIGESTFASVLYVLIPAYLGADVTQNIMTKKKNTESGSGGQPEESIGSEK